MWTHVDRGGGQKPRFSCGRHKWMALTLAFIGLYLNTQAMYTPVHELLPSIQSLHSAIAPQNIDVTQKL